MKKIMLITLIFSLNTIESPALGSPFFSHSIPSLQDLSGLFPFQNMFRFNPRSSSTTPNIAYLLDMQPTGVGGGSCIAGEWRTRTLNTLWDADHIVSSFQNNQFTLPAGSYNFSAVAPAAGVKSHQLRLVNSVTQEPILIGSSEFASLQDGPHTSRSGAHGLLTLSEDTVLELQHQCSSSEPDIGFGIPTNFGTGEIYTQARIIRLASNNPPIFYLYDKKTQGTPGGSFKDTAWHTRTFSTLIDPHQLSSLTHNGQRFTLKPGVYNISGFVPAVGVNQHKAILYNVTAQKPALIGTSEYAPSHLQHSTQSTFYGFLSIKIPSVFEIRHRCSKSALETGFGAPASFGPEIYTQIRVFQLSSQPLMSPAIK